MSVCGKGGKSICYFASSFYKLAGCQCFRLPVIFNYERLWIFFVFVEFLSLTCVEFLAVETTLGPMRSTVAFGKNLGRHLQLVDDSSAGRFFFSLFPTKRSAHERRIEGVEIKDLKTNSLSRINI